MIFRNPDAMRTLIASIQEMVERHDRFTYDLRARCRVLSGVVAAYRAGDPDVPLTDPAKAIARALDSDGILGARRDPQTGVVQYDSCRVFTDQDQALRFAMDEDQRSIFNLNRMIEVPVTGASRTLNLDARVATPEDRKLSLRA